MKKFIYTFTACSFIFLLVSCQPNAGNNTAAPTASTNLKGFMSSKIANDAGEKVTKTDASGNVLELGTLVNGKKNGSWTTYYPNKEKAIKTLASYVNDELNGVFLTFSNRGQLETLTTYANGVYDGYYAKYKFSNIIESGTFINGKIEGVLKKFYDNSKIQMEAHYKNGVQHGNYKYFDNTGNVTMEFEYANGEKISGGVKK